MVTSLIHTDSGTSRLYAENGGLVCLWLLEVPWSSGHLQAQSQSEIVFSKLVTAL